MEKDYKTLKLEQIELLNNLKTSAKLKLRNKFKEMEWFFSFDDNLPNNWIDVNILDVTWLVTCGVAKKPNYIEKGIPFLSAQNARPFKANLNKIKYISQEQFETLTVGGKPKKNDILYTRVGNCGEAAKVPFEFDFAVYVSLTLIKPIHELIDSDYLVAFLNSHYGLTQANKGAIGIGLKNLNVNNVRRYRIPLPPLKEQQRIVAKLDTLFTHLDRLKTRLANIPTLLKHFRQAILTQAVTGKLTQEWRKGRELENYSDKQLRDLRNKEGEFENRSLVESGRRKQKIQPFSWNGLNNIGWAQVNVESAAIFIIDCLHSTPKFELKGEYVVDTTCISPFKIHWRKARKINQEYFEKWITRLAPRNGDILFSREGTIGIGVKVPKEKNICIGQRMMLFRFGSYILPEFSEIYINSMVFRDEFRPHIKGVAAQHLNIGDIRKLNFPIPSKEEQTEIVKRVENLFAKADKIEAQYAKLKEKIDRLPQAILAKAFKGELVPQLPTDGDAKDLLAEIQKLKEAALSSKQSLRGTKQSVIRKRKVKN